MKLDTSKWQSFELRELFDISTPKKKFNAVDVSFDGKYPYIVRSEKNNGIRGYISEDKSFLNKANTISFGQDTATMFYQQKPYFTGDKIKIFTFREEYWGQTFNENIALYLIAVLKIVFSSFNWGSSSYKEEILNGVLLSLPTITKDKPDWEFMENCIKKSKKDIEKLLTIYRALDSNGGGGKIPTYTTSSIIISEEERDFIQGAIMEIAQNLLKDLNCEWGEFKIGKLFSVKSNPQLNKNSFEFVENGEYPYFTRTVYNNGILGYVKYLDEEHKIKGNSIAVGLIAMHFFYMQKDFYAGQFTKTIYPKFKGFNKNIALFFTALFNANKKQYLKNFIVKDFEKDFLNTNILLSIDSKGNPNFALMESFIKNIETKHTGKLIAYYKYLKLANHNSCAFKASL
ncbi:hypothetical protein FDW45_00975 [Campylobacter helveticus]|uniref:restriction endonuclease subunit S n=2 Tax=Campylobacter helveticus TaxID=28898 RepID=UPI0011176C86|nr:restriction endonuclease subunit S [Campylobacter helveticus]TNH37307.1 hypothetical protein FDW45_00975 [Campylobacter helveticus]